MNLRAIRPAALALFRLAAAALIAVTAGAQDQTLQQAARLDSEHKCAEAEALYRKAAAVAPDSTAVLNNFGNHYLACALPDDAQAVFERVVRLNPAHVNANLQLARLALTHDEAQKSLDYLARINARDAADPEISLVRAEALARSGKRGVAADLIRRISSAGDPRVLYGLGMMCARNGFYREAESAFSRVLAHDPDDFDLLFNLGLAAARAGHPARARTSFEAALKARPSDADALFEWGRVETTSGDYNHAVYLLAQAAKAAPARAEIALALARAAQMGGYYGDSLLAYDRYITAHPDDEMVRRDRALVAGYTRAGLSEALAWLTAYVDKHPRDAIGFYDLAQLSYRADRTTALAEVTRAIQLDSHLEQALFFRAWLLKQAGRYEESQRDAKAAADLNPMDARALDLVGLDDLELAKPVEAEKPLRRAVALSPAEPDFLFHLGRCLMESGRRDEARPILAEFQKNRMKWTPAPREEPGVIEAATLSPGELARRVVNDYKKAVQDNPNEPALSLNLARALVASGETDEAMARFRQLLAMEPPAGISREAGAILVHAEQYALARDFLRRSAGEIPASNSDLAIALWFSDGELIPGDIHQGDYLALKAIALNAAGRNSEALQLLEGNPEVLNARLATEAVLLLMRNGQAGKALDLIERARHSSPDDGPIALMTAAVMARLNRTEEAERVVKEVEARWPQWDRAYAAEALLLERMGRSSEAKARIDIAAILGPGDPVTRCVRDHIAIRPSGPACPCESGVWILLLPDCRL